jgi:hypothetical protein
MKYSIPLQLEKIMKLKTLAIGAMLAVGCAIGFNVHAMTLSECCRIQQQECVLNYGTGPCANVYDVCMRSRHCILN